MEKVSLSGIAKNYFNTLYNARTDKISVCDVLIQIGVPFVIGILSIVCHFHLTDPSNIIIGISIVSALMCAMAVLLFQIRTQLREKNEEIFTDKDIKLVNELFDDVLWAIVVGLALALFLIIADATNLFVLENSFVMPFISAITALVTVHFAIVICMCLKRLQKAYYKISDVKD